MDKKISRQFFNDKAANWDNMERSNSPAQLSAMAARIELSPQALVMDVGTGTGVFVPYIKEKLVAGGQVICVDFAFNMLEIAQHKNGNPRVAYVCAEIETVGFPAGVFDAVMCYSTFPHFHNKPLALKNIHDLLRPGGKVFICHTASRENINNIHRNIHDFQDHLIPQKEEMADLMVEAGFIDLEIDEREDSYLARGLVT